MRTKPIVLVALCALTLAIVIAVAPNVTARAPTATANSIDILGLTKAAANLPEQSFVAH